MTFELFLAIIAVAFCSIGAVVQAARHETDSSVAFVIALVISLGGLIYQGVIA